MSDLNPFPLEKKIKQIFTPTVVPENWPSTGKTKDLYVKLSEPIVRQAVPWQDKDGRIIDPFEKKEAPTATARFVGALGFLISASRCLDLVDVCARSVDIAARDLFSSAKKPVVGPEFYIKELMRGYCALRDKVGLDKVERWKEWLGGYDPEETYSAVFSKRESNDIRNFVTFAMAGEGFKKAEGIADNDDFIERYLEQQKQFFTEFGMYRDPNDPMTYDWTPRMNLSLLRYFGYKGRHAEWYDEILKRGALTMLLYLSSTGEAPFGGRSNQQNFNEATIALICEYEARRYKKLGKVEIAGAFKHAARLAALSTKRWLDLSPIRFTKNGFPPESQHGRQTGYGFYSAYSLLIASQFGFAHLIADDAIEERPAACEVGGYILHLPGAFHKIFATCSGYHIEIDTKADHHYDATGLGRIHRLSLPTELGLSGPIVPNPDYLVSVKPSERGVAIGPGWEDDQGNKYWLAGFSDEIENIEVKDIQETTKEVQFKVVYTGRFKDYNTIIESYRLNSKGLEIEDKISGGVKDILVQIPLLETDGQNSSEIEVEKRGFKVKYMDCLYRVECLAPKGESVDTFLEAFPAPNRNGIYKVGCFKTKSNCMKYRLSLHEKERPWKRPGKVVTGGGQ